MNILDTILNRITMYRVVLYVLSGYTVLGIAYAFAGRLPFTATELVVSFGLILAAAYATDRGLGRLLHVPTNRESALITSLILLLIVRPADSLATGLAVVLAGIVSSAAKFFISWNGKHIFNPAALGASVLSLSGLTITSWWIGSSAFWPVTLLFGLAVVRKIRRFALWISFAATALTVQGLLLALHHQFSAHDVRQALIASPLIFLSTIMLTEPATMPPRRKQQMAFGGLVAILYVAACHIGRLVVYPEVALLLGNIYAFAVSPRFRLRLKLVSIQQISERVYHYTFKPDRQFSFLPGQYMEWTLPRVAYDSRGNRRTFTIASSPTEETVQLGVKYYQPSSAYKTALARLKPGDIIFGSQIAGNFTLPADPTDRKIAFIAGGIGITPFRSMIKYLTDAGMQADAVLIYAVADIHEAAYRTELAAAKAAGVRTILLVTDTAPSTPDVMHSKLDAGLLGRAIPDYAERTFYVSGPNAMVHACQQHLRTLHIANTHIRTDHFSGY